LHTKIYIPVELPYTELTRFSTNNSCPKQQTSALQSLSSEKQEIVQKFLDEGTSYYIASLRCITTLSVVWFDITPNGVMFEEFGNQLWMRNVGIATAFFWKD
jgi:hypothetical protein